ncbi:MAG: GNAT family N-acetyltransferase [Chloroflexi bacterium]|nr:MAG: GNAT family N-acetyltransferase [Chloroflexota bacterium]MBL1193278.1 GNAT family N-acetyltransferase [Chloroflexota bacterium]NOH10570.1 GNAT family N-acetyltransferase [Chloroflexota bacterium]
MTEIEYPQLADYTWQPLSSDHIETIQAMHAANAAATGTDEPPPEKIHGALNMLGDRVATNSLVALTKDSTVAALGLMLPQPGTDQHQAHLDLTLHVDHNQSALGGRAIGWLEKQAVQQLRPSLDDETTIVLRATCPDDNPRLGELFEEHGYQVFVTQIRMRRDLDQPIREILLPDEIKLIPYSPEYDDAMRMAFNAAFEGHWIGELGPEEWTERFTGTDKFAPELSKIALVEDSVVGFYLSEIHPQAQGEAWLEVLGVIPSWRGHRLGVSLTTHALHKYKQAGYTHAGLDVDLENITNAMQLYEKLGFQKVKGTINFVKQV